MSRPTTARRHTRPASQECVKCHHLHPFVSFPTLSETASNELVEGVCLRCQRPDLEVKRWGVLREDMLLKRKAIGQSRNNYSLWGVAGKSKTINVQSPRSAPPQLPLGQLGPQALVSGPSTTAKPNVPQASGPSSDRLLPPQPPVPAHPPPTTQVLARATHLSDNAQIHAPNRPPQPLAETPASVSQLHLHGTGPVQVQRAPPHIVDTFHVPVPQLGLAPKQAVQTSHLLNPSRGPSLDQQRAAATSTPIQQPGMPQQKSTLPTDNTPGPTSAVGGPSRRRFSASPLQDDQRPPPKRPRTVAISDPSPAHTVTTAISSTTPVLIQAAASASAAPTPSVPTPVAPKVRGKVTAEPMVKELLHNEEPLRAGLWLKLHYHAAPRKVFLPQISIYQHYRACFPAPDSSSLGPFMPPIPGVDFIKLIPRVFPGCELHAQGYVIHGIEANAQPDTLAMKNYYDFITQPPWKRDHQIPPRIPAAPPRQMPQVRSTAFRPSEYTNMAAQHAARAARRHSPQGLQRAQPEIPANPPPINVPSIDPPLPASPPLPLPPNQASAHELPGTSGLTQAKEVIELLDDSDEERTDVGALAVEPRIEAPTAIKNRERPVADSLEVFTALNPPEPLAPQREPAPSALSNPQGGQQGEAAGGKSSEGVRLAPRWVTAETIQYAQQDMEEVDELEGDPLAYLTDLDSEEEIGNII